MSSSSPPPATAPIIPPIPSSNPSEEPNPKKRKLTPPPPPSHNKLPRLPDNLRISKRPLLHPPIAPTRSSSTTQKVIYLSASTPFIATIKRVRTYLSEIEARASGPLTTSHGSKALLKGIKDGIDGRVGEKGTGREKENKRDEEVLIKGSGKAIQATLKQAVYWQGQEDVRVVLRTGTVGAVDDVVDKEDGMEVEGEDGEGSSRVRRVSYLEVGIRLV